MTPEHFLSLFETWADAMLIGQPDREILRRDIRDAAQAARVPKVRTSHHRNKEEAARLQELVAKRYVAPQPTAPFNGSVALTEGEFAAAEKTLLEPQEPSEGSKRGAKMLEELYGNYRTPRA